MRCGATGLARAYFLSSAGTTESGATRVESKPVSKTAAASCHDIPALVDADHVSGPQLQQVLRPPEVQLQDDHGQREDQRHDGPGGPQ